MSYLDDEADIEKSRAPLMAHLVELRKRLIICVAALVIGLIACFSFAKEIYLFLLQPYQTASTLMAAQHLAGKHGSFDLLLALLHIRTMPGAVAQDVKFVFTGPLEFFFAKLKLAGFGAIVITFPVIAFQLYRFVAPGLYRRERKAFLPFLIAAPILFIAGAALVYFIILPFVLWFALSQQIVGANHVSVELLPKVSDYLSLVTTLLLAFGLCFQLPIVLSLLGLAGILTSKQLISFWRYAIVAIVALAAVVTPPDIISQITLSIPLCLLYAVSILCVWLIERGKAKEEAAQDLANI